MRTFCAGRTNKLFFNQLSFKQKTVKLLKKESLLKNVGIIKLLSFTQVKNLAISVLKRGLLSRRLFPKRRLASLFRRGYWHMYRPRVRSAFTSSWVVRETSNVTNVQLFRPWNDLSIKDQFAVLVWYFRDLSREWKYYWDGCARRSGIQLLYAYN